MAREFINPQPFDRGVEFQTYTWEELSSSWKWDGRELTALYIPISGEIPVGSNLTLETDHPQISGMWNMKKSPYPVKIYMIGPDEGSVSVTLWEWNGRPPLGNSSTKFVRKHGPFTNRDVDSETRMVSSDIFWQDANADSYVYLKLDKAEGTSITRLTFGNADTDLTVTGFYSSSAAGGSHTLNDGNVQSWHYNNDQIIAQREYGLSVYFSVQGFLEYAKNNTYINPKAR